MKTFKELEASDFPNVDSQKCDEWKTAVLRARRNTVVLIAVLILANVVLILISGTLVLGGLLLALLFVLVWYKAGRLQRELGIDKAAIRLAKARISTAGHMLANVEAYKRRFLPTLGGSLLLLLGFIFLFVGLGAALSGVEHGWEHIADAWYITLPIVLLGCGLILCGRRLLRGRLVDAYQCLGCGKQMQEHVLSCPSCNVDFGQGNPTAQPVEDGA